MTRLSTGRLWSLCALTILANVIILFVAIPEISSHLPVLYDQNVYPDGYDQLATNLVEGNGYRFFPETASSLMREPGYPILLAGLFFAFGKSFTAVKVTNLLLAVISAWLVSRIARRLSDSRILMAIAPLLFLFHPGILIAETRGGVELLFVFLITLFMLTVYRAIDGNRRRDYLISGGVLGLTVLVKSTPMLFPLFLLACLLLLTRRERPTLATSGNIALMVGAMLVVLSPWIVRNYSLTGQFVPTASVLGVSAHAGQYLCKNTTADNRWEDVDRDAALERTRLAEELGYSFKRGYYQYFYSSGDELSFSNYLFKRVMNEYRESPSLLAKCMSANLLNIWFAGKSRTSVIINLATQLPYLILAIAGAVLAVKSGQARLIAPLALFIVYYVAVYVPILAQARYSVPLIPFLSIFAGITLLEAQRRFAGSAEAHVSDMHGASAHAL